MGPVRQELRAATQPIHDRLDRAPVLRPLTSPDLDLDSYRAALLALHGFHGPVERALGEEAAGRLDLLRADLAVVGIGAGALDAMPAMTDVPPLDSHAARLAARYVLDGSAHGGRAMLPNVTRTLGFDATRGARFLASAGIDAAGQWKELLARLETDLAAADARAAACAAAVALFAALERWLDRCAAGLQIPATPHSSNATSPASIRPATA